MKIYKFSLPLLAKLARIAIYFLEETQRNAPNDMPTRRYEAELNALHDIVQKNVLSLLTDSKAVVKRSLIESGICELCAFFGKEKGKEKFEQKLKKIFHLFFFFVNSP